MENYSTDTYIVHLIDIVFTIFENNAENEQLYESVKDDIGNMIAEADYVSWKKCHKSETLKIIERTEKIRRKFGIPANAYVK